MLDPFSSPFQKEQALASRAPVSVLFVCHGNICRSTMAQSIMGHLVRKAGEEGLWTIDSAATSTEEIGNPPHPGTVAELARHGIPCVPHRARRMRADELGDWDLVAYMDGENLRGLRRILGPAADDAGRVRPLLSFADTAYTRGRTDVADPWYTGDFEATFRDVYEGCKGMLSRG